MAREGPDPLRRSHWSLLSSYRLPLRVLSCVIVTIRDFVFFLSFFSTDSRLVYPVVCFFLIFLPNMVVFAFLRNRPLRIEISKIKISRLFWPFFFTDNRSLRPLSSFFQCRGGFDCANPGEWHNSESSFLRSSANNLIRIGEYGRWFIWRSDDDNLIPYGSSASV